MTGKMKLLAAAATAGVMAGMAGAASAATIVVTYTGEVLSNGQPGPFATPGGGDLTGKAFRLVYRFDPSKGATYQDASQQQVYGGTYYGADTPLISATLTIGGHGVTTTGGYNDLIATFTDGPLSAQQSNAYAYTEDDQGFSFTHIGSSGNISAYVENATLPPLVAAPYSGAVRGISYFGQATYSNDTEQYTRFSELYLANEHLTIALTGVPEPATWALMIAGFGAAGGALRRRTRGLTPAIA